MKKVFLFITFAFLSCNSYKATVVVNPLGKRNPKLLLTIPKGYNLTIDRGGGETTEYLFYYKDSALIYLTNKDNGGPNYYNIYNNQNGNGKIIWGWGKDTLLTSGTDKNKLLWSHFYLGKYHSIGYRNVQPKEKAVYDSAIASIKVVYKKNGRKYIKKNELK